MPAATATEIEIAPVDSAVLRSGQLPCWMTGGDRMAAKAVIAQLRGLLDLPDWQPGTPVDVDLRDVTRLARSKDLFAIAFAWGGIDADLGAGSWRFLVDDAVQASAARRLIELLDRGVSARCELCYGRVATAVA